MADEYQQQIESGKKIIRELLTKLADELKEPAIATFQFIITAKDFDEMRVSLQDPKTMKIVVKLADKDLADCATTPETHWKISRQVIEAVRAYCATAH
jgi:hypothetical protein